MSCRQRWSPVRATGVVQTGGRPTGEITGSGRHSESDSLNALRAEGLRRALRTARTSDGQTQEVARQSPGLRGRTGIEDLATDPCGERGMPGLQAADRLHKICIRGRQTFMRPSQAASHHLAAS